MKTPFLFCATVLAAALLPLSFSHGEDAKLDFGDFSSATITGKAWKASEAKKFDEVLGYTGKCIEMFKAQAIEQQKALSEPPTEKEKVFAQWALNDVGTCYLLQGRALEEQGKKKEGIEAYKFLATNLPFAQCWDTKGWFWKPAEAAKERIKALEFDTLK
jgi:tetratricopeptide (TPR) repeat protein